MKYTWLFLVFILGAHQSAYSTEKLSTELIETKLTNTSWISENTKSNMVYSKSRKSLYVILDPESGPGYIAKINPETGKTISRFNFGLTEIAFAREGTLLSISPDERTLIIDQAYSTVGVDLENESKLWNIKHSSQQVKRYFSSDSRYNVASGNPRIYLHETRSQKHIRTLEKHILHSGPAIFVNNDTQLFSSSKDGTYALWNVRDGSLVYRFKNSQQRYRRSYAGAFLSGNSDFVTLHGGGNKPRKFRIKDGTPMGGVATGPKRTTFEDSFKKVNSDYLTYTDPITSRVINIRPGPYTVSKYTVLEDIGLLLVQNGPIRAIDISILQDRGIALSNK